MFFAWDYILMLPADHIRKAAKEARTLAAKLERAADRKDQHQASNNAVKRHRLRAKDLTHVLAARLYQGMTPAAVVACTARETGQDEDNLWKRIERAQRLAERRGLEIRNRRMVKMARQGLTDGEIAAETGLHPKSVNRILSKNWSKVA